MSQTLSISVTDVWHDLLEKTNDTHAHMDELTYNHALSRGVREATCPQKLVPPAARRYFHLYFAAIFTTCATLYSESHTSFWLLCKGTSATTKSFSALGMGIRGTRGVMGTARPTT